MIISEQTKRVIIMCAVDWGMSWTRAEEQLDLFLGGNESIDTAQIQNVVNRIMNGYQ